MAFRILRATLSCNHLSPRPPILRSSNTLRFFSSSLRQQSRRSYPHRQFTNQRQSFFRFLDDIPQNTVFWSIITVNGVVFVMWYMASQRLLQQRNPTSYKWMADNFTSSWENLSSGRIWTIVTSIFSHQDLPHLLFNGFTFYFMAKPVLSILGSRSFLFLYLGGGTFANLASMGWSKVIKHRDGGSQGGSAAIYSTTSFLACVAPKMKFLFYAIIPVPAWLAVTGIFAYDTYSAVNDKNMRTDTAGHVAGLFAGAGYFIARRLRLF